LLQKPRVRRATDESVANLERGTTNYRTAHEAAFNAAVLVDEDAQREIDAQGATIAAQEQDISKLATDNEETMRKAGIDGLTGLPNREKLMLT